MSGAAIIIGRLQHSVKKSNKLALSMTRMLFKSGDVEITSGGVVQNRTWALHRASISGVVRVKFLPSLS